MVNEALVQNHAVAGLEDLARTLRRSQRIHRPRIRQRSETPVVVTVNRLEALFVMFENRYSL